MNENALLLDFIARHKLPVTHSLLVFVDGQLFEVLSQFDEQLAQIINKKTSRQVDGSSVFLFPADTIIINPVYLLFVSTKTQENKINNVIEIGASSKVMIVEKFVGFSDALYTNHISTTLKLAKDANVDFYKVQNEAISATHFADLNIYQATSSKVNTVHLGFGGINTCENINVFLEGEQASCDLRGLYVPKGKQSIEYHLTVEHKVASCSSKELFKGIVDDCAHATFDGKVIVYAGAIQSSAKLNNRNLLFSDTAQVTAKPALEIYADDVQCTHGATVGQLDQAAVWYLRSRGIPEAEARQMLIDGFMQEITAHLPEFLRAKVENN